MEETGQNDKALPDLIEIIQFTENISTKIHGLMNEAEIFGTVKEQFAKSKKYTVSILLLTDDGTKLRFEETSLSLGRVKAGEKAIGPMSYKSFTFDVSKSSIFSQVIRQGKTIEADFIDAASELLPRPLAYLISKIIGYEKRSGILTPLERRGKIIGMLVVDSTELAKHFIPSVRNLAKHISTALELAEEHAERRKMEEMLKETNRRLEMILETAMEGVAISDPEDKLIFANRAFAEMLGYKGDYLLGMNLKQLTSEEGFNEIGRQTGIRKAGKASRYELVLYRNDGEPRFVQVSAAPLWNSNGRYAGSLGIVMDISERKKMENALRESEERYRNLVEHAPDAILTLNMKGVITSCNAATSKLTGYSRDEIIGRHFTRLGYLQAKDIPKYLKLFSSILRGKMPPPTECSYTRRDGTAGWAEAHVSFVEAGGKKVGIQVILMDITERKKAEEQIRIKDTAIASSINAIALADLGGNVTYANSSFLKMWGFDDIKEILGKPVVGFWQQEDQALEMVGRLRRGEGWIGELTAIRKDGSTSEVQLTANMVKDGAGRPVCLMGSFIDITERKRMENALAHERDLLQALMDNVPDSIYFKDSRSRFTRINRAHAEEMGVEDPEEAIGKTDFDFYPDRFSKEAYEDEQNIVRSGQPLVGKIEKIEKDGRIHWFSTTKTPMIDREGNINGIVGISRDIADLKRMEEALRVSEEEARSLLEFQQKVIDTAVVWIDLLDKEGNVILWNRAAELISGYSREEVVGHKKIWEWLYPDPKYRAEPFGKARQIIEKGERIENYQSTIRCKDGRLKTISWYSNNISDSKGEPVSSIAVGIDVTERKQMEKELARERDLLHALMDNIPDAIYFKDTESRFTRTNKAHAQIIGISDPSEAMGKTDFDFYADEFAREAYADEQEIIRTGRPMISKVEKVRRPDGHFKWVSATKVPIMDGMGRVTGLVGISRDITERMRMEEELKRYSEHLEELVEERTKKLREAERLAAIGETAAMVGHDLRNPLQVMSNLLYLARNRLKEFPLPLIETAEQRGTNEVFGDMGKQIEYMNKIVSDLQDYARPLKPELVPTNLQQIINETLSTLTVPETIKVSMKIPEDLPNLMIDPPLMKRVFTNLITNALQAMADRGQLTMEASRTREATLISVHDTGVGIPEENLDKLFQPLFTTKSKGQGFGLAVCKRVVEAHGGNIMFKSQLRKGSTFTVEIPIGKEVS